MKEINIRNIAFTFAIAVVIWFIPVPDGVTPDAWHLFAIFAATILGIILKAAPMGTMCMMAIGFTALTGVGSEMQVSQLQKPYRIWRQSNLANRDILLYCPRIYQDRIR